MNRMTSGMYVVVRKGYEHPEIVAKYVSAIFDQSRYANDASARELNDYFSINVDRQPVR